MGKKERKHKKHPFVSICTPTFNRRPFIPIMIQCFEHQTYPKDRMEWIIIDDGTDKIEDMVSHIPQVKYFKYSEKLTLGKKRNLSNEKATGDIIVYMDDDDYYPPERVTHAVKMLQGSKALCAGSSAMNIYFKHIDKMIQFGPYGPNHATAATFAFKRELLDKTRFEETSCVAEEKKFLKDYTIPFVQLDSSKTILVFSHIHNSFDKKELLKQVPNPNMHDTTLTPKDIIKETNILKFFMEDIDVLLEEYEPGKTENKPDVLKQLSEIKKQREEMIKKHMLKQQEEAENIKKMNMMYNNKEMIKMVTDENRELKNENRELKITIQYLENKIKKIIQEKIQEKINQSVNV